MTTVLLALHFIALTLGLGAGVSNLIVGRHAAAADPSMRPTLGAVSAVQGKIATGSLILLWLTGISLVYVEWGGWGELPSLFTAKLAAVVALTICSVLLNLHVIRAAKAGTPPPAPKMARLGELATTFGFIALILAVIAF